jgi:hypothetical protein
MPDLFFFLYFQGEDFEFLALKNVARRPAAFRTSERLHGN